MTFVMNTNCLRAMSTQNTYIDKRTIEGLTVGIYIITPFEEKCNNIFQYFSILSFSENLNMHRSIHHLPDVYDLLSRLLPNAK